MAIRATGSVGSDGERARPAPLDLSPRIDVGVPPSSPPSPLELPARSDWSRPESELRPDHGDYRIDDGPIAAKVRPDGSVALRDKSQWRLPLPGRKDVVKFYESWKRDPVGHAMGRLMPGGETVKVFEGGMPDITDVVMRAVGEDPYAARKLDLLDRTRDERAGIAAVHRRDSLRESIPALRRQLAALWRDRRLPAVERRRLLFDLWDECAETGSDDVVASAATARAVIVAFIRRKLPPGSRDAYTDAELRRLNASRTSSAPFAPYAE